MGLKNIFYNVNELADKGIGDFKLIIDDSLQLSCDAIFTNCEGIN